MKTELRSVYTPDEKGVAVFVTLILLFIVTIAGVTILAIAGRDRIASSDMSAVRGVAEAANTAIDACENQLSQKSPLMLSVINKYLKDKSYRWFFSTDSLNANKEKKVSLGNGYFYSAEIMAYDTSSNVLQVRGIGYGRSDERKSVVAQYRLTGLQKNAGDAVIPRNAIYIKGDGRNFDQKFDVTGNVFVGTVFHINNAHNCRIRGYLKTGYYPDSTSSINGQNFIIDSGAYFGTGLKLNSHANVTCGGMIGIEGNLDIPELLLNANGDGWFNGAFNDGKPNTTISINMSNNTINHSGSLSMSRVQNKTENNTNGKILDIPQKIGIGTSNDSAWGLDTTGLYAKASTTGKVLTAESLNLLYQNCTQEKLINGYMVIHDDAGSFELKESNVKFKGKVIMLLRRSIQINSLFFDMEDAARILMIVTGLGGGPYQEPTVNGLAGSGDNYSFNGLIYLRDAAKLYIVNNKNYTINGAIHLASIPCDWQLNNGTDPKTINFKFNESIIREFVSMGIITIPTPGGLPSPSQAGTLQLTDFKIRPELLSVSY
jgi:hypothetical protein